MKTFETTLHAACGTPNRGTPILSIAVALVRVVLGRVQARKRVQVRS